MKGKIIALSLAGLFLAALVFVACGTSGRVTQAMTPGTYSSTSMGHNGPLSVEVSVSANAITDIRITNHVETPGLADWALELIPARIMEHQSLAVDRVTGVTITSIVIKHAVEDCLRQAGANVDAFKMPIRRARVRDQTLTADVIIVGGGGAGLTSAISATDAGASVILIEKAGFIGGNSIVAGGIYNAPGTPEQNRLTALPGDDRLIRQALDVQPTTALHRELHDRVRTDFEQHRSRSDMIFDSPEWFALQTWLGGDRVGNLSLVYRMALNSLDGLNWVRNMGAEFRPQAFMGSGSLYRRTLRTTLPNTIAFINAFSDALDGRDNYTQLMETTATGLIIEGGRVVGVNAVGKHGNRVTLRANRGVILATGGFGGNVELRRQFGEGVFWPYLGPTIKTTNVSGVTGDGIFFARDAGAELIDMEHIQLLHVANPKTGFVIDNTAHVPGIAGMMFVNREGNRFVREDGRRDEISTAILAQTDRLYYMIMSSDVVTNPDVDRVNDGRSITFMLENNLAGYVKADTLEELARLINVNPDNLAATIREFNDHVRTNRVDRFGREVFGLAFERGPWYAYPRTSSVHYTMGGVRIDEYTRAIRPDGTPVPGLFAAGEITGGIHGSNRLGGNAIVDFVVFGRIAGASAAAGK